MRSNPHSPLLALLTLRMNPSQLIYCNFEPDREQIQPAGDFIRLRQMLLQVLSGARMPVDGLVLSGKSHADESMLTGEAEPVLKSEGNAVIGGTMNLGGTLQVPSCLHAPHWVPSCLHVLVRSGETRGRRAWSLKVHSVLSWDLLHHGSDTGLWGVKEFLLSLLSLLEQV